MKIVVLVSALFTQLMLPCPATKFDPHYFRPIARVDLSEGVGAETGNDLVTPIICASTAATAFLGFECTSSTSSSSSSKAAATVSHTATYDLHALAIGDWGVDLGLGSCCNVYRKTGTENKEYYKDQQAQINVAHLLTLSAKKLQPKVILGHGDNFYWNGLGSDDSESIGEPPPYATEIKPIWRGENAPYGIFELSFAADQMKLQFVTFDDDWVFAANKANTVKGGAKLGHCWLIPKDGSLGEAC
ncbi:hypothetical protein PI125_g864 [Phytophthora idaei]|nr:hypothetical protein PI125_g864 [Phytophthora idaei]KAG3173792.1 hypothetical protein PI126_g621 [Phytophthora idaei]